MRYCALPRVRVTRVYLNRRSNCTLGPWVRPPDRHIFDKKCGLLRPLSTDTTAPSDRQSGAPTHAVIRLQKTADLHLQICNTSAVFCMQRFAKHLQRAAATCATLATCPVPSADVPAPFGVVTDKDVSRLCGDLGRTWLKRRDLQICNKSATNQKFFRSKFASVSGVCLCLTVVVCK